MKFFILLLSVCFIAGLNNSAAQNVAAKSQANFYLLNQDNTMLLADNISTKPVLNNKSSDIVIDSNAINNNAIDFKFNDMPTGVYNIKLKTSFGQLIAKESLYYDRVTDMETIQFNRKIAKGAYKLEISGPGTDTKSTYNLDL